jgi:REP element-mobilizing transposase RayT
MIQTVNFRLADSLPKVVIAKMKAELSSKPESEREVELRRQSEKYLDAGHGKCWLREPAVARIVQDTLLHFDKERYRLLAWCIMPNHVHALIETSERYPLATVIHSWKSFTAHEVNKNLNIHGEFWQREYMDRYVRNTEHCDKVIAYIEENPVKARLARVKTDWLWSSAKFRAAGSSAKPGSAGVPPAS